MNRRITRGTRIRPSFLLRKRWMEDESIPAAELREKIDGICIEYHYFKNENVIEKAKEIIPTIQKFCTGFLQGNSYGISEEEYQNLQVFVIDVLKDYVAGIEQEDVVWIIDTLDYGLRELIELYIDDDAEESEDE